MIVFIVQLLVLDKIQSTTFDLAIRRTRLLGLSQSDNIDLFQLQTKIICTEKTRAQGVLARSRCITRYFRLILESIYMRSLGSTHYALKGPFKYFFKLRKSMGVQVTAYYFNSLVVCPV